MGTTVLGSYVEVLMQYYSSVISNDTKTFSELLKQLENTRILRQQAVSYTPLTSFTDMDINFKPPN